MNPRTKIKVDRRLLMDAVEAKRVEEQSAHDAAFAEFRVNAKALLKAEGDRLVAEAKEQAAKLKAFNPETDDVYEFDLPYSLRQKFKFPDAPKGAERALAQLRMSTEDTISLSVEDFERYL